MKIIKLTSLFPKRVHLFTSTLFAFLSGIVVFAATPSYDSSFIQQNKVSGKVTNEKGQPLLGAIVLEKGTENGVQTDFDGNYIISVPQGSILVFSYLSMSKKEVQVRASNVVNVVLKEEASKLDEIVVTSLGISRKKRALGYAATTIKSAELVEVAQPNIGATLYGKAPGVRIYATPGGSTSPVNIQIRGINSITGRNQPLIVLDGIPIRNGETSTNYYTNQRIQGNGLTDINPEDIDNISILKGASAAALYGSRAVNGVVLITSKKGTKRGLNINVNISTNIDQAAYLPETQTERGPGMPSNLIADNGQNAQGFIPLDTNGDGVFDARGVQDTNLNFGPKFDGNPYMAWDGNIRPYVAPNNYAGYFRTAANSSVNVSASNVTEKSNIRFSVTRQDYESVTRNSNNNRNAFNFNSTFNLSDKMKVDVVANYINRNIYNRPYLTDRLVNNFNGMISTADNPEWYLNKYQTSKGYRFVAGKTEPSATPNENIIYNGSRSDILDYFWRLHKNLSVEKSDRLISSVTHRWDILEGLNLRTRISTDITHRGTEDSNYTEAPLSIKNSGSFSMNSYKSSILYGDILLAYTKDLTGKLNVNLMAGYNGYRQEDTTLGASTNTGLSVENWFDIASSVDRANSSNKRVNWIRDALIGTINFNYDDFLFVETTIRRDRTSTMNPKNNAFVYPSINTGFVFSDIVNLPSFIDYGKLRASYGIVGNYPEIYKANVSYSQSNLGVQSTGGNSVIDNTLSTSYGNDDIAPERKHEMEFGFEMNFFKNRLTLDASYYNAKIENQILQQTASASTGATSNYINVGVLRNQGIEVGITGTPIMYRDFRWNSGITFSSNKNVIEKLSSGADELIHHNYDGNAAQLVSKVGRPIGDILVHPVATNDKGEKIIDANGLYKVDPDKLVIAGNAMPIAVGGVSNTFTYKGFSLDVLVDFRIGGAIMPTALNWMTSRGLTQESLNHSDKAHGGVSYYENGKDADKNVIRVQTNAAKGPNGQKVYDNGILLDGVKLDGSKNTQVVPSPTYYNSVYNWGGPQYSPNTRYELYVQENTYFKMRELSLRYKFSTKICGKIGIQKLQVSVFARNLFFFYKNIDGMDPEQSSAGSRWSDNITNVGTNPATRTYGVMVRIGL